MSSAERSCACGCGAPVWKWMLGRRCAFLLAGSCLGKGQFASRDNAAWRQTRGQEPYACLVCGAWHNGAIGAITPELREAREQVIAGLRRNGYPLGLLIAGFRGMDRQAWKKERKS